MTALDWSKAPHSAQLYGRETQKYNPGYYGIDASGSWYYMHEDGSCKRWIGKPTDYRLRMLVKRP